MRLLFIILLFAFVNCNSQEKRILSLTHIFSNDTTYYTDPDGNKRKHFKIHIDSSEWRLYAIRADTFFYFKLIGYGTATYTDPPLYGGSWISNALAYYSKTYMQTNYLLDSSKVEDTIPYPIRQYSAFANADNPNADYGHTIIKYYAGGLFGELIREEHLNDGKKRK